MVLKGLGYGFGPNGVEMEVYVGISNWNDRNVVAEVITRRRGEEM